MDSLDNIDQQIINFVEKNSICKSKDIISGLNKPIDQSTLSRRMQKLVREQYIDKIGGGRSTSYCINKLYQYLSTPPHKREKIPYDFGFLEKFDPYGKLLFNHDELEELSLSGQLNKGDILDTKALFLHEQFALDLAYASSQMEGSSYSYIDTQSLLDYHQYAEGKSFNDARIILNHRETLLYQFDNISNIGMNEQTIKETHALLSRNLETVLSNEEGVYRKRDVNMTGSSFIPLPFSEIKTQIEILLDKVNLIEHPFNQSLFLLSMLPYVQPFVDVNKRVGRLMCNIPLMQSGYAPLSFRDMNKNDYTMGIIGLYELKQMKYMKNAFKKAYLSSSPELVKKLNEPLRKVDALAMKYHRQMNTVIKAIVKSCGQLSIKDILMDNEMSIESRDEANFSESVYRALSELHIGQLVIYRLTEEEFFKYKNKCK